MSLADRSADSLALVFVFFCFLSLSQLVVVFFFSFSFSFLLCQPADQFDRLTSNKQTKAAKLAER